MFDMLDVSIQGDAPDGTALVNTQIAALDTVPAGPELAAALAAIDSGWADAHHRVDLWRAKQRLVAHYQSSAFLDQLAVEDHFRDERGDTQSAFEGAASEFEVAGHLSRRGGEYQQWLAGELWRRLPAVGAALFAGRIDLYRARRLITGTTHLPEDTARTICEELLEVAGEMTAAQLSARIKRRAIEDDPGEALARYEDALEERRAVTSPNDTGTANFHILDAAPEAVMAAARYVDHLARELKRKGDTRPIDQLRSDVALDLLQGNPNTANPRLLGGVHIHTSLETLSRLAETPGELAGYGPVIADIARQTAEQQTRTPWEYVVTDDRGDVIASGTTQRRPTNSQSRWVRAIYRRCVFPGCGMPAEDCDLDHQHEYAKTGLTCANSLYPHCRHHHRIRHEQGWTYRRLADGKLEYTTRLGRKYLTQPRDPPLE